MKKESEVIGTRALAAQTKNHLCYRSPMAHDLASELCQIILNICYAFHHPAPGWGDTRKKTTKQPEKETGIERQTETREQQPEQLR